VIAQLTLDLDVRSADLPEAEAAAVVADFKGRYAPIRGLPAPRCCCDPHALVFAAALREEIRCALCGREP
jgi:hypothetical protein